MKISSLYPIIKTKDLRSSVEFFYSLGMVVKHDVSYDDLHVAVMENEAGNRLDICTYPDCTPGFMGFRINTDNFEETSEYFKAMGCQSPTLAYENKHCIIQIFEPPLGMKLVLIHHKK